MQAITFLDVLLITKCISVNYLRLALYVILSFWACIFFGSCKYEKGKEEQIPEKISIPYREPKDKIIRTSQSFFYVKNEKHASYFEVNGQPVLYYEHAKNIKNYPLKKDSILIAKLDLDTSPAVSIIDISDWKVMVKNGKIVYRNEHIYMVIFLEKYYFNRSLKNDV